MKSKKHLSVLVLLSLLIICALSCVLTACGNKNAVAPTGITLNKSNLTIMQGQTFQLVANVKPNDATDKRVKWSVTQAADFVSVSEDGTVTALAVGVAQVTATTKKGKFSASCNVAVIPLAPTDIELNTNSIILGKDATYKLKATIKPNGATGTIAFTSDNPTIATVGAYDGTIAAKSPGETVIKANVGGYNGIVIAECKVQVGYKITVNKEGNGTLSSTNGCYYSGSSVSLTATPQKGYLFNGWYQNDTRLSTATTYSYKVTGNAVITAKFVKDPDAPEKNSQGYYEIKTNKHLVWASENPNDKYILKNNITADGSFKGFDTFTGIFDGKGYSITGYNTDSGFFKTITGKVKNLTLKNVTCDSTSKYAGLLASRATDEATIENCSVQGSINIKYNDYTAGGLIAYAEYAVIKNCSADVTVSIGETNYGDFGGLVGNANDCQFTHCSAKVNTEITFNGAAIQFFGGLLGRAAFCKIGFCYADIDADVTVLRSYNLGFGGLIGYNNSTFDTCYSTGSLTLNIPQNNSYNESGIYFGGMIGKNQGKVAKCYSAVDITLSGGTSVKTGHVAGFCGNNEGAIRFSVYCGHFTASGAVVSCARPFTYTVSNGSTDNVYYVRNWYFNTPSDFNGTIHSNDLNKDFFMALEFQERFDNVPEPIDGWVYDKDGSLPHF